MSRASQANQVLFQLLKKLQPGNYNVTVVSPLNYFLFTPLLPAATVGTIETRSLMEPIRKILLRLRGTYLEGEAQDIDFNKKVVKALGPNNQTFEIPYDKLVIAVGAETNTFGIPGVKGLRHPIQYSKLI
jgi:NADH dehydrogenase